MRHIHFKPNKQECLELAIFRLVYISLANISKNENKLSNHKHSSLLKLNDNFLKPNKLGC
jgi:hypothetical protein